MTNAAYLRALEIELKELARPDPNETVLFACDVAKRLNEPKHSTFADHSVQDEREGFCAAPSSHQNDNGRDNQARLS